jgi:hypothetical protein
MNEGYVVQTSKGAFVADWVTIDTRWDSLTDDVYCAKVFGTASGALSFVHALVNERAPRDGLTRNPLYIRPISRQGIVLQDTI